MSGAANANGSPAKPVITLAQYEAAAAMSGMDAAQAHAQGQALLASMYQRGIIDQPMYHEMLGGAGEPSFGVADTQAASVT